MASLPFTTYDVFTTQKFSGNPLAVVTLPPSSPTLSQAQKQAIAREFNYSETVFLHPRRDSPGGDGVPEWRVDIFTTETELPFAGHPTIWAACHVLGRGAGAAGEGRFEVGAGAIELRYADGVARASIPHDTHVHGSPVAGHVLLGWQEGLRAHYAAGAPPVTRVVSPVRGMNFATTRLRDLGELAALGTPGSRLVAALDPGWDVGPLFAMFYVDLGVVDGSRRLRTRMIEGAFEDPATGSASCGLAVYLCVEDGVRDGRTKFEMEQGVEMGRRSIIGVEVRIEGGVVKEVLLEGSAVEVMRGTVGYE